MRKYIRLVLGVSSPESRNMYMVISGCVDYISLTPPLSLFVVVPNRPLGAVIKYNSLVLFPVPASFSIILTGWVGPGEAAASESNCAC